MKEIQASIIVPCYNEEFRMQPFLDELKKHANSNWEYIFVNDGSKDNTLNILEKYTFPNKKIISYRKNMGKGYAVKSGVLSAKGKYVIFIDADGSIHPSQINNMLEHLKDHDVVVGNRSLKNSNVVSPSVRKTTGILFNFFSRTLFALKIRDSLCGFKGFKKKAADALFRDLISDRWVFDVELFYKIKKNKHSLYNLPIKWEHRDKSKIFNFFEIVKVFLKLVDLRIKLMSRKYK